MGYAIAIVVSFVVGGWLGAKVQSYLWSNTLYKFRAALRRHGVEARTLALALRDVAEQARPDTAPPKAWPGEATGGLNQGGM